MSSEELKKRGEPRGSGRAPRRARAETQAMSGGGAAGVPECVELLISELKLRYEERDSNGMTWAELTAKGMKEGLKEKTMRRARAQLKEHGELVLFRASGNNGVKFMWGLASKPLPPGACLVNDGTETAALLGGSAPLGSTLGGVAGAMPPLASISTSALHMPSQRFGAGGSASDDEDATAADGDGSEDEAGAVKDSGRRYDGAACRLKYSAVAAQFGLPLGEAAQKLGVCRTTLKRVCRKYGIRRWPRPKQAAAMLGANGILQPPSPPIAVGRKSSGGASRGASLGGATPAPGVAAVAANVAGMATLGKASGSPSDSEGRQRRANERAVALLASAVGTPAMSTAAAAAAAAAVVATPALAHATIKQESAAQWGAQRKGAPSVRSSAPPFSAASPYLATPSVGHPEHAFHTPHLEHAAYVGSAATPGVHGTASHVPTPGQPGHAIHELTLAGQAPHGTADAGPHGVLAHGVVAYGVGVAQAAAPRGTPNASRQGSTNLARMAMHNATRQSLAGEDAGEEMRLAGRAFGSMLTMHPSDDLDHGGGQLGGVHDAAAPPRGMMTAGEPGHWAHGAPQVLIDASPSHSRGAGGVIIASVDATEIATPTGGGAHASLSVGAMQGGITQTPARAGPVPSMFATAMAQAGGGTDLAGDSPLRMAAAFYADAVASPASAAKPGVGTGGGPYRTGTRLSSLMSLGSYLDPEGVAGMGYMDVDDLSKVMSRVSTADLDNPDGPSVGPSPAGKYGMGIDAAVTRRLMAMSPAAAHFVASPMQTEQAIAHDGVSPAPHAGGMHRLRRRSHTEPGNGPAQALAAAGARAPPPPPVVVTHPSGAAPPAAPLSSPLSAEDDGLSRIPIFDVSPHRYDALHRHSLGASGGAQQPQSFGAHYVSELGGAAAAGGHARLVRNSSSGHSTDMGSSMKQPPPQQQQQQQQKPGAPAAAGGHPQQQPQQRPLGSMMQQAHGGPHGAPGAAVHAASQPQHAHALTHGSAASTGSALADAAHLGAHMATHGHHVAIPAASKRLFAEPPMPSSLSAGMGLGPAKGLEVVTRSSAWQGAVPGLTGLPVSGAGSQENTPAGLRRMHEFWACNEPTPTAAAMEPGMTLAGDCFLSSPAKVVDTPVQL